MVPSTDREARAKGGGLSERLESEPWSIADLFRQLDVALDAEGRPLSERRATIEARRGVVFDVGNAAYGDERDGMLMNVSALQQITAHLKAVVADIRGFHALSGNPPPSWPMVFTTVVDQLVGPVLHQLTRPDVPIPALRAVGHKLAAGYFGVLRNLFIELANGRALEPSAENLLAFVEETRALVGASEACAGPPKQIAFVARVLFGHGSTGAQPVSDSWRLPVARALATQIRVGIAWELFDRMAEQAIIGREGCAMSPKNPFIGKQLEGRRAELGEQAPGLGIDAAIRALPETLSKEGLAQLGAAFSSFVQAAPATITAAMAEVLTAREGALLIDEESQVSFLAERLAQYALIRCKVTDVLEELETEVRVALGLPASDPVRFASLVFPAARTQRWFEALLGYRFRFGGRGRRALELVRPQRTIAVALG